MASITTTMRLVKRLAIAGVLVLGVSGPVVAGLKEGVAAYNRGDYEAAYKELLPLARTGNANVQFILGVMYRDGLGVSLDYNEAVKWFRKAAERGHADAQFKLGYMYQEAQGVSQDYAKAVRWYRKAAEQGDADAQFKLGIMYREGWGVQRDFAAAVRWYRKAAEQGNARAQTDLGLMYDMGLGVPQDYAAVVRWYRKAAEQGKARAQFRLGIMYSTGRGVPQDYQRAHMWFNLAAAHGDNIARKSRDTLAKRMTRAQIAEAQRLAQNWQPKQQATVSTPSTRPATNRRRIARIQRDLGALGYDPGIADGILGPKSRAAIRAFQAREGLPVTGAISESLEAALRSATRAIAEIARRPEQRLRKASTGSGFAVSAEGHVLTNRHVVRGCGEVRVAKAAKTEQLSSDTQIDLALLKITPAPSSVATFRNGRGIRTGDDIIVAGFPLSGLLTSDLNVTKGSVSALAGPGDDRRLIQITAPVQPGNSGGPVFDVAGNVVGVVVARLDALKLARLTGTLPQNVNFAISEGATRAFLDANNVPYEVEQSKRELPSADVAAKARNFTVLVECWK